MTNYAQLLHGTPEDAIYELEHNELTISKLQAALTNALTRIARLEASNALHTRELLRAWENNRGEPA